MPRFDYQVGFRRLKDLLRQTDRALLAEVETLEERFWEDDHQMRLYGYGPGSQVAADRNQVIGTLNDLALDRLGVSFNELCQGGGPQTPSVPTRREEGGVDLRPKGSEGGAGPVAVFGTGDRRAVLVGVNEYDDWMNYGRLKVCVKDVQAVRDRLIAGGFSPGHIRLLADGLGDMDVPTKGNILAALQSVARLTGPDDLLLFYYSGHGEAVAGEPYLVARDGQQVVLADTGVPVRRVKDIMRQAQARAKVIILDACQSGAEVVTRGALRMSEEFIRRVFYEAAGMAILASCQQGEQSYEWQAEEEGAFTHFLLEALSGQADLDGKGFVSVQDAARHVVNGVREWAARHNVSQTPTLQAEMSGDILLVRCPAAPVYSLGPSASTQGRNRPA